MFSVFIRVMTLTFFWKLPFNRNITEMHLPVQQTSRLISATQRPLPSLYTFLGNLLVKYRVLSFTSRNWFLGFCFVLFLTRPQLLCCRWSEKHCLEWLYDTTFLVREGKYLYKASYKLKFRRGKEEEERNSRGICKFYKERRIWSEP